MKVLVCGGRNFKDREYVREMLDLHILSQPGEHTIIHGAAVGADTMAGLWAVLRRVKQMRYPAQWKKLGLSAGPIRNQKMLDDNPNIAFVIAFPGGVGTADMCSRAEAHGIEVRRV